jgi:hypothetical protein
MAGIHAELPLRIGGSARAGLSIGQDPGLAWKLITVLVNDGKIIDARQALARYKPDPGTQAEIRSARFSGGLWTSQLSARCPVQHAVDHYVNGEAKPFVDISSDKLSGVGGN